METGRKYDPPAPAVLDQDEIYVLDPDCRLYPDDGRVAVVDRKKEGHEHRFVSAQSAVVAALLDGKRTIRELIRTVQYLAGMDEKTAGEAVAGLARVLPLVKIKDVAPGTRLRQYRPEDFIAAGGRPPPANPHRLRQPLSVLWMPTLECPVRCIYCYLNKRHVPKEAMLSHERNLRLLREFIDLDVPWLSISGGDLFMHEHIFEYLEILNGAGLLPENLPTKVPLTKEKIRRLTEIGIKKIQYSIDGANAETCDFLVQTPGWFDRSVQTIRALAEAGILVRTHVILNGHNADSAEETILFLYSLGSREIAVENYGRSVFRHSESLWVPKPAADKLQAIMADLRTRCPGAELSYKTDVDFGEMTAEEKKKSWPPKSLCTAYTMGMTILADGECIACEQILQDDYLSMGNVRDKTILEVWNSPRVRELARPPRDRFKGTACFDCEEFEECVHGRGYCFRFSYAAYGSIYAPSPNCPRAPKGFKLCGCI